MRGKREDQITAIECSNKTKLKKRQTEKATNTFCNTFFIKVILQENTTVELENQVQKSRIKQELSITENILFSQEICYPGNTSYKIFFAKKGLSGHK